MTEDARQSVMLYLSALKTQMKKDGLIFGIVSDMQDVDKSKLCIIDKEKYLNSRLADGLMISISDLNDGLL